LSEFDINYYLSEQPPNFWIAVIVIGLLLLIMLALLIYKLVGWSLALPLVMFAEVSPARSFVESNVITRGKRREILFVLGLWGLLAFLLGLLVLGIVQQLGAWTVPAFYGSIKLLVPVLGGFVALWVFGNFLVTVFTSGSFAYVLVSLYDNYGPDISEPDLQGLQQRKSSQGWRLTAGRLAVALPVAAVVAALMGYWLLQGMQVQDEVKVIAHRGAAGAAPENTLASIRRANADGTDWVEIDVQETADGEVVVIHDSDFMKLAGNPLKVWEGTLAQIQDIDIGSWFAPEYSGERVPTLREVLAEVAGQSRLVIELKYYGHDQRLEQRVVDIVEQAGMVDDVAIMSLKYEGVQKIRKLRPDWTIGLLAVKALGNLTRLDVDFLAVNTGMATPGFVRRAQDSGKRVWVWTVNDAVTISRVMSLGVNGIITDEPALAREVIEQRAELGSVERLLVHAAVLFGRPVPVRDYRDESP
jgi:glycerophosphoryl diester phosphodiesterase